MTTADIIDAPPKELSRVALENGLAPTSAAALIAAYRPHFDEAHPLIEEARGITVTDATQVTAIKAARRVRLALREVRVAAEKTRKALKEDSLRTGKAIDGMNAVLKLAIEPEENRLEECEKFAERAEAARQERLRVERSDQLVALGADARQYVGLGQMPDEQWKACLHGAKLAKEEREKAAEAERIRVAAETAERDRLRVENERLRKEQAEKDAQARKEREAIEAKARAEREAAEAVARQEREAREKLEREAAAKRADEAKKAAAEAEAKRRAELAPDADKLRALAKLVRSIEMPAVCSAEAGKYLDRFARSMLAAVKELERDAAFLT